MADSPGSPLGRDGARDRECAADFVTQRVIVARPVTQPGVFPPRPPASPLHLLGLRRSHAALDAGLVAFVTLVIPIAGGMFMAFVSRPTREDLSIAASLPYKVVEAMMVVGLAAYLMLRQRIAPAAFGIHARRWPLQAIAGVAGWIGCYGYLLLTGLVLIPLAPYFLRDMEKKIDVMQALPHDEPGYIAVLLIFVVVHEELLFRGMLLPLLRRATGSWLIAVALAGGVFGVLHLTQGFIGALQVTGLGVLLSVMFVRTRSLLAVMIAHYLFNFSQIMLLPRIFKWLQEMQQAMPAH